MTKSFIVICPEEGHVVRKFMNGKVNNVVGSSINGGYLQTIVNGKNVLIHRLIFEFVHGPIPTGVQIDHINGVTHDNRIVNLRLVSPLQNMQNQHKAHADNKTGTKGVYWDKHAKKFRASITVNGKPMRLGYFLMVEDAGNAYKKAASIYHTHNPFVAKIQHLGINPYKIV